MRNKDINYYIKKELGEVVSDTTQLKLTAAYGKKCNTNVISWLGVESLAKGWWNV